jgi:glycerophosphoryl diester phosphodiesterase
MHKPIHVWGHRGSHTETIKQNSLSGIQNGLKHGTGIEVDAVFSADRDIFLLHDTFYDPATGSLKYEFADHLDPKSKAVVKDRFFHDLPTSFIQTLRLENGEIIPSLDDLLSLHKQYPDRIINIEVKSENGGLPVLNALKQSNHPLDNIVLSSFNIPELIIIRKQDTDITLGVIFHNAFAEKTVMFPWTDNTQSCFTPAREEFFDTATLDLINPDYLIIEVYGFFDHAENFVLEKYPDKKIVLCTTNLPIALHKDHQFLENIQRYKETGQIHAIIADYPHEMNKALSRLGIATS